MGISVDEVLVGPTSTPIESDIVPSPVDPDFVVLLPSVASGDSVKQISIKFDLEVQNDFGDSFDVQVDISPGYGDLVTSPFAVLAEGMNGVIDFQLVYFEDDLVGEEVVYTMSVTNADVGIMTNPSEIFDSDTITFRIADVPEVKILAVCFAPGTEIATPDGARRVERLRIGDRVSTADGRTVAVKWIGRQVLHKLMADPDYYAPVRVKAGALGPGCPDRDLVLTSDHALIIDGFAINAGALVNGSTILKVPEHEMPYRSVFYHIETDDHEVVLANGAPAETFIDYTGRQIFDNHAEYQALYGDETAIPEMTRPRISAARLVPDWVRAKLDPAKAA